MHEPQLRVGKNPNSNDNNWVRIPCLLPSTLPMKVMSTSDPGAQREATLLSKARASSWKRARHCHCRCCAQTKPLAVDVLAQANVVHWKVSHFVPLPNPILHIGVPCALVKLMCVLENEPTHLSQVPDEALQQEHSWPGGVEPRGDQAV
jgi:hypothetical protein